ncbi:MAG: histidinol-phosphatase, partial [Clostridia bacterium]|nr:histidinol-phosphatase [Clostridia bacterium]
MYRYETHLHTFPVSRCAKASVEESLRFYKSIGYDGVFVTNHFVDGNINIDKALPYEEQINFYFSDYEKALELSEEIGIKVFLGIELSYKGTDCLVYGLDKKWFLSH